MPVMELQPMPFRAAAALRVHESAPPGVALVHGAADGSRHVTRRLRGMGVGQRLPRSSGPGETLTLQARELFCDRALDDRGEVAVGNLRAHQRRESLDLVSQLGARREL